MEKSFEDKMRNVYSLRINHQYMTDLFSKLDELRLRRKWVNDPSEIQHAFLTGPSGVGKTTLVRSYIEKNPKKNRY